MKHIYRILHYKIKKKFPATNTSLFKVALWRVRQCAALRHGLHAKLTFFLIQCALFCIIRDVNHVLLC